MYSIILKQNKEVKIRNYIDKAQKSLYNEDTNKAQMHLIKNKEDTEWRKQEKCM